MHNTRHTSVSSSSGAVLILTSWCCVLLSSCPPQAGRPPVLPQAVRRRLQALGEHRPSTAGAPPERPEAGSDRRRIHADQPDVRSSLPSSPAAVRCGPPLVPAVVRLRYAIGPASWSVEIRRGQRGEGASWAAVASSSRSLASHFRPTPTFRPQRAQSVDRRLLRRRRGSEQR